MKRILISVVLAAICLSSFGQKQEEKKKFQDAATHIPMLYAANTSKLVNHHE